MADEDDKVNIKCVVAQGSDQPTQTHLLCTCGSPVKQEASSLQNEHTAHTSNISPTPFQIRKVDINDCIKKEEDGLQVMKVKENYLKNEVNIGSYLPSHEKYNPMLQSYEDRSTLEKYMPQEQVLYQEKVQSDNKEQIVEIFPIVPENDQEIDLKDGLSKGDVKIEKLLLLEMDQDEVLMGEGETTQDKDPDLFSALETVIDSDVYHEQEMHDKNEDGKQCDMEESDKEIEDYKTKTVPRMSWTGSAMHGVKEKVMSCSDSVDLTDVDDNELYCFSDGKDDDEMESDLSDSYKPSAFVSSDRLLRSDRNLRQSTVQNRRNTSENMLGKTYKKPISSRNVVPKGLCKAYKRQNSSKNTAPEVQGKANKWPSSSTKSPQKGLSKANKKPSTCNFRRMQSKHGAAKKCQVCDIKFDKMAALKQHVAKSHQTDLKCFVCCKVFLMQKDLDVHLQEIPSHKQGIFYCQPCQQQFSFQSSFRRHQHKVHPLGKETFSCDQCPKKAFKTPACLTKHKERCHFNTTTFLYFKYKCTECSRRGQCLGCIAEHMQTVHPECTMSKEIQDTLKYKCNLCDNKFAYQGSLKSHKIKHSGTEQFLCNICGKQMKSITSLEYHLKAHERGSEYIGNKANVVVNVISVCKQCNKSFKSKEQQEYHQKRCFKEKNEVCEVCQKKFHGVDEVAEHMKASHYKCDICAKWFIRKLPLDRHRIAHDFPYMCNTCYNLFSSTDKLDVHLATCNEYEISVWLCNICNFDYLSKSKLRIHVQNVHAAYTGTHKCTVCSKLFTMKQYLQKHMATHTGEKNFECNVCGKRYKWDSSLRVHKAYKHSTDRPYHCAICYKTYKISGELKTHMQMHANVRAYKCENCPKTFKKKDHLVKHTYTHSKEKCVNCSVCGHGFTNKYNLTKHTAVKHTRDLPHKCTYCKKEYFEKYYLKRHLKNVHGVSKNAIKKEEMPEDEPKE